MHVLSHANMSLPPIPSSCCVFFLVRAQQKTCFYRSTLVASMRKDIL